MRTTLSMALPSLAALAGLILLAFGLAERPTDERAALHRSMASRAAYLMGLAVLSAGTLWQTYWHALDPWLVSALGAVTLGKIAGWLYGRNRR